MLRVQQSDRKIDLTSQFSKVTTTLKLKNTGTTSVHDFLFCDLSSLDVHATFTKVTEGSSGKTVLTTTSASISGAPENVTCFSAALSRPLAASDVVTVVIFRKYTEVFRPFPAEIGQLDPHLVVYEDNVYLISPYHVSAQTTEVIVASTIIKSWTSVKPAVKRDNKITYGRYDKMEPLNFETISIHFEHNRPFKQVTKLVREIEVSHWGNIYVEEVYEVRNGGALHQGPFSRLKYLQAGKGNSFRELKARLPPSAHSLYYVDLIGNISTSNVFQTVRETSLDFELRYPLMGGWKADFTIGYSTPLEGFLFRLPGGRLRLTEPLGAPIEDVYVQDLEVRVVLPEGAYDISTSVPTEVSESRDVKFTYLDTAGRPVVVLRKSNVVWEHNQPFHVDYSFPPSAMLREPLLLVAVFAAFFAMLIFASRFDVVITKDEKWKDAQNKEKVATHMTTLHSVVSDLDDLDDALAALTAGVKSDGLEAAQKERLALEAQRRELDAKARDVAKAIEDLSARSGVAVRALLDKSRALHTKFLDAFTAKVDLLKKGAPIADVARKTGATAKALQEEKAAWQTAHEVHFAAY